MANREFENIDLSTVCLETPFTEDRIFNATTTDDVAAGTVLTFASGKFIPATGADQFNGVMQYDVEVNAIGDVAIRPVLAGKVRADKIFLAAAPTTALTAEQRDKLKANGIIAVQVEELSKFNNPGA